LTAKRYAEIGRECVACGCCVKVCPRGAIAIYKGTRAVCDIGRCVGCGRCADECPANVISMSRLEASA
jgi:Pyruvate/2-oxoacid:ferredoxin oxidoreductase delta subunit